MDASLLDRRHGIPLHRQLAARLEAEVRGGRYGTHDPLPSVRDLAGTLGVHRHTVSAAYRRLRERRLVRGGARRRLVPACEWAGEDPGVAGASRPGTPPSPRRIETFERSVRVQVPCCLADGAALARVRRAVLGPVTAERFSPPVLVEPRAGLRRALAAELGHRLGERIEVARAVRATPGWGCRVPLMPLLARAELVPSVASRAGHPFVLPLRLRGGLRRVQAARSASAGFPGSAGSVVGLLTGSSALRRYARELTAAHGVRLAAPRLTDAAAVTRMLRVADPVWVDHAQLRSAALRSAPFPHVIRPLDLLDPGSMERIAAYVREANQPIEREGATMQVQVVTAEVRQHARADYLRAWVEWTGSLYAMGIRSQLLSRAGHPDRFLELTWFEEGAESALADDRLVRAAQQLDAHAHHRTGALDLWSPVELSQP